MNTIKRPVFVLIACLAAAVTACNSDVFVEQLPLLENEITLKGDGGTHSITFSPKGLIQIGLDLYDSHTSTTYYNKKGDMIAPESPASEVARINYTNQCVIFDIFVEGRKITFQSTENAHEVPWYLQLFLDYGYTTQLIHITLQPGQPIELADVSYRMDEKQEKLLAKTETGRTHYINGTNTDSKLNIRPYLSHQSYMLLETEKENFWISHLQVEMPLPVWMDGEYRLSEPQPVTLGSKKYFLPKGVDTSESVPYTVPAGESVYIVTTMSYSGFSVPFDMLFRNPVSGRQMAASGICNLYEPTRYEIRFEHE